MTQNNYSLPILKYLQSQLDGTPCFEDINMKYPTAISKFLKFRIVSIDRAKATLELMTDLSIHSNQQGTVHGGLICELADAAIGTAHSTLIQKGQSFTSIDLKATFLRPVWESKLLAFASIEHQGRTISHYKCEIERDDGKKVALINSAIMTLNKEYQRK